MHGPVGWPAPCRCVAVPLGCLHHVLQVQQAEVVAPCGRRSSSCARRPGQRAALRDRSGAAGAGGVETRPPLIALGPEAGGAR
jgi:hypothetical protein